MSASIMVWIESRNNISLEVRVRSEPGGRLCPFETDLKASESSSCFVVFGFSQSQTVNHQIVIPTDC